MGQFQASNLSARAAWRRRYEASNADRELRWLLAAAIGVAMGLPAAARDADPQTEGSWAPDAAFVQWSSSPRSNALGVGAQWDLAWSRPWWGGTAGAYFETLVSRWRADAPQGQTDSALVTQIGLAPVVRWRPGGSASAWFYEASIGVNVIAPIYQSRDTRFSTVFNFGEHLAVGRSFGEGGRHEIALRVQHFSNAGIRHPNPGEDFVQLRYAKRL
jgi:lipid A 3-O-deacylase